MKKILLQLAFLLLCCAAMAQNIIHVDVCTKFWPASEPVTACTITATVSAPGFTTETTVVALDSTESCAGFDFDTNQYPANAAFSFSATKDQDDPLNGVTTLDLVWMSKHILGVQPLPSPLAMIAADVNRSNSITTFDLVEERKLILGSYTTWPSAPVWRFIPEYQLPFPNPNNPFQSNPNPGFLTVSQMQALNGSTIALIGAKTGDVDGDANTLHSFWGPDTDSLALKMPDVLLQAGVPTVVPISMEAVNLLTGMQLEISSIPGAVAFDGITVDPEYIGYFLANVIDPGQKDRVRVVMLNTQQEITGSPVMYLHLTAHTDMPLKAAIRIKQADFYSLGVDTDNQVYRLFLDFSSATAAPVPQTETLQVIAATPNPFTAQAQVQIALSRSETVLLEVMDVNARLLFSERQQLAAGTHILRIPGDVLPNEGMVLYRVTAGRSIIGGKLMRK